MDTVTIMMYLVGTDEDNARGNLPFDSLESAQSFMLDNPMTKVYSVEARIDFTTLEEL